MAIKESIFQVFVFVFFGKFSISKDKEKTKTWNLGLVLSMSMKSLERVVSEKALKLGNSFPCQICVVGFLCGICLTSLFLAALTSLGTFELAAFSFSSSAFPPCNSSTSHIISKSQKI